MLNQIEAITFGNSLKVKEEVVCVSCFFSLPGVGRWLKPRTQQKKQSLMQRLRFLFWDREWMVDG
jgi:hypothetical protein